MKGVATHGREPGAQVFFRVSEVATFKERYRSERKLSQRSIVPHLSNDAFLIISEYAGTKIPIVMSGLVGYVHMKVVWGKPWTFGLRRLKRVFIFIRVQR